MRWQRPAQRGLCMQLPLAVGQPCWRPRCQAAGVFTWGAPQLASADDDVRQFYEAADKAGIQMDCTTMQVRGNGRPAAVAGTPSGRAEHEAAARQVVRSQAAAHLACHTKHRPALASPCHRP